MIVAEPGGDGRTLWMRTTFGILVSHDGGRSFRWICEKALGFSGQFDPPLTVLKGGRLVVGMDDGILSSVDGCSFVREPGIEGESVRDLTTDGPGNSAFAITGARGKPGRVWRREPSGKWTKLGPDYENTNFLTIDVAPSNPKRIYLTGESWTTVRGEVWLSNDGGKTFADYKNEMAANGPFFLSYVDPKDQDHIIVRHLHFQGSDVLVSRDGGKTLKLVVHWASSMQGFAKSDDGQVVWLGSGNPSDGIWRSTDRGDHYEPINGEAVACLYNVGKTLYTCANPSTLGGYALGISNDEGRTLQKVSGFADVEGAMLCDAGPSLCEPSWPETRATILPTPDAGAPASGVDAAAPGLVVTDGGPRHEAPPSRSSCGCQVVGERSAPPWSILWLAGLIPLMVWGRARRHLDRNGSDAGPFAPTGEKHPHD